MAPKDANLQNQTSLKKLTPQVPKAKPQENKKQHSQETACSLFSYKRKPEETAIVPFAHNLLVKMPVTGVEDGRFPFPKAFTLAQKG